MLPDYDVIVVGGGHAGCEAAAAAANMGSTVLLITMDMTKFGQMSCNPAMGGIAKGQIVREIDALGGYSAIVTDKSMIQFRMLNRSKGPAMWSPRAQCDRVLFSVEWRNLLENTENLDLWQDQVVELIINDNKVGGIKTKLGIIFKSKTVILTNGTFINGLMHVGRARVEGGRAGESSSTGISEQLLQHGFEVGRMKTGTPARIDGRTIDFSKLQEQKGDEDGGQFSFLTYDKKPNNNKSCWITYTGPEVHEILETGFDDSPLYNGTIEGIGPRYCPSIEDKIVTFADKEKHQLFLEPEGHNTVEYYINGFSSSLPWEIQYKALRKIAGLENVKIFRPGYAIEYDYFPPTQLYHTLETKKISNLYFAGQINGTTGYEEAAAQGLMAGINATLKVAGKESFVLSRDQAYIGVLIDDLVTKGVDEPYRMFTSRAEYRILLRQDNADIRLTELSNRIGLAKDERLTMLISKIKSRDKLIKFIKTYSLDPEQINPYLIGLETSPIKQKKKLFELILRPQISINQIKFALPALNDEINKIGSRQEEVVEAAEVLLKYSGYIEREQQIAEKLKRLEHIKIPANFEYEKILSLSTEGRQKLKKQKPESIGQATRISGVSPSDISVLLVYMGR
ncbi:MAG: tRNA uridine-5-carboxymethylaminomethyl(34) synthesis enzyme MnmG [Bacteroidetes bacterium GWF2_33_16]|nr:MAG: tRNA uridine-5-carboxymethylaminomethyl(34) synthesis enzyme MnmG [Bacteroidetes bacterium GWE2_32_14]OFY03444.1 MAG: tRNA uridine-5-carboxymethylaminomethyl(34) synthesis enzyme MnmG [Bacteroidetes bacterium GWF2_33_16]